MVGNLHARLVAALLVVSLFAPLALAQEIEYDNFDDPVAPPAGTTSCFDYYTFGSVQANLATEVVSTVSGALVTFSGTLRNDNPYPLVDGTLYVKIFKNRTERDGNGPDVVDQFVALDGVTLPAEGSKPVSFSWRVPAYAVSGEYRLATYFTTSDAFNLLGLTFTDDVIGNTVPFAISGEQDASVMFDKGSVTVNGNQHYFAAYPPRVSASEPVTITAAVQNESDTPQEARVSWTIYRWDAQKQANAIQTEESRITIPARGSAPASITMTDTGYPVYYAVGTVHWHDAKSVIGVRFGRMQTESFRINFPGITSFPLKSGEANTLFSCLHNTSDTPTWPGGRLELTLSDKNGARIAEHVYSGDVTSAMMGVASQFTPGRNYDYVTLEARLFEGDTLVDEARVTYDCAAIDSALCSPKTAGLGAITIYGLVGLLALLILLIIVWKRMHRAPRATSAPLY